MATGRKNDWQMVVGLEVHVQLKTNSKIFCSCRNGFSDVPNSNVCPVCMGFPGVLPVFNEQVLNDAILVSLALNCSIAPVTKFDRKHYFYPDLPKAYQISQYDMPLAENGFVDCIVEGKPKRVRIKRLHMEEDAGKLVHTDDGSYVDYNRAGSPLLEIVSEPDIFSSDEAYEYLSALKMIVQYTGVSDCDMEKGSLRCDANISIRRRGDDKLGTKVEIKNMNSFKAVKAALEYEARRQAAAIESGKGIVQETRLWDPDRQATLSMRSKEEAHDYRYFPEPDLLPIHIPKESVSGISKLMPELPYERQKRFEKEYGLSSQDAGQLCFDKWTADLFESAAALAKNYKRVANIINSFLNEYLNLKGLSIKDVSVNPSGIYEICALWDEGAINNKIAKDVFFEAIETGASPKSIVAKKGLTQVSDSTVIEKEAERVIAENPNAVKDYLSGKENAVMFLVGQVMKAMKGKANPQVVKEKLVEKIRGR